MIEVSGGEIEYELIRPGGTGGAEGRPDGAALVPLVFLHEGLGSLAMWRGFPRSVCEATGRVGLVWSRHGYGRSSPARTPRAVRYMHDEALSVLPELLDRLGIEAPILVGHSDGASIALIFAGGSGRPASGVVAIAPHVFAEGRSLAGIEDTRRDYISTDLRDRLGRYHRDPDAAFWGWNDAWLDPSFLDWNIEEVLPGISCPVLLVQCEDDAYGSLAHIDRIEGAVKGTVERLVFTTGGHGPHVSHPAAVRDAIAGFVRDLP
ncbi:MAG: alpha/beta fold hydrolase [Acidimicrobiales bacterium]